ncbi:putative cystine transporter YijE [bacterium HR37]|nr:putative cystine transporter YijE [bacterium HR37]
MKREYAMIIAAALLYGTITPGGHLFINLGLSVFELSLYRLLFIFFTVLPLAFTTQISSIFRKDILSFFTVYGFIGAILETLQFTSLYFGTPVAVVALLLYTQPIWTVLFGKLILDEAITKRKAIAILASLLGVYILLKPWEVESKVSFWEAVPSLIAGIFLALWVVWGRRSSIRNVHCVITTLGWSFFSALWLMLIWVVLSFLIHNNELLRFSIDLPTSYWIYMALFGLIGGVIPSLLFYRGLEEVQASIAGILLLIEPVSASFIALLLFDQPIDMETIFGGGLILLSNYMVLRRQTP